MPAPPLRSTEALRAPSTADLVFDDLYRRVVELDLAPGAKLSELEVARRMGVSRQPVRDAFYRLSQIGLLHIQPQRATTVSRIAEAAVLQARFIRTALETETARAAADRLGEAGLRELEDLVARQAEAVAADDRVRFHALDDAFHRVICAASGHEIVWSLIRETKAHMDRARFLSLSFGAQAALDDHRRILGALRDGDAERAAGAMRVHLSRIGEILAKLRAGRPEIFNEA